MVHYNSLTESHVRKVLSSFVLSTKYLFSHCDIFQWNGLNILPDKPNFGWQRTLAHVDKKFSGYTVTFGLPEKPRTKGNGFGQSSSELMMSIETNSEFDYPGYTLHPPYFKPIENFYSTHMNLTPSGLRVEKNGIAVFTDSTKESISLYPIDHQTIINRLLTYIGITGSISQAGLITKRIIEKLTDIDGARIFKIKGVRELMQKFPVQKCFSRSSATKQIWDEGRFKKYEELHIAPREKPLLTVDEVFDFLLEKEFLRAGLELKCTHCQLVNWFTLGKISDWWVCEYCGFSNQTSIQLKHKDCGSWKYRKSGLFAKDNNQEGAIPVILTLWRLLQQKGYEDIIYSPSLNMIVGQKPCEIDFVYFQRRTHDEDIATGIAECKSEYQEITAEDIHNILLIRDKFLNHSINCYPIFSKTSDTFKAEEITLFRDVQKKKIPMILFTNRDLEPYHLAETYDMEKLPNRHPTTLGELAWNSSTIYLSD